MKNCYLSEGYESGSDLSFKFEHSEIKIDLPMGKQTNICDDQWTIMPLIPPIVS